MIELTINEACQHPECFLYVWASDNFLNAIKPEYASIIRVKRANESKVLMLSAKKYLGDYQRWTEYRDSIKKAFIEIYDVDPLKALIILAQGGSVAGKNWAEGVFGVGSLTSSFKQQIDGKTVTVDKSSGHLLLGGTDITDPDTAVMAEVGGKTVAYQYYSKNVSGYVFGSIYNKTLKKYYADCYSDAEGKVYTPAGKEKSSADSGSIWGNINLSWDWIRNILNWILSLFGIPTLPEAEGSSTTLSATNTLPNQTTDGFVSKQSGLGTAGILLVAAAAGTLLMSKGKGKKKIF